MSDGMSDDGRYRDALIGMINGVTYGLERYDDAGIGLVVAALERGRDALALIDREANPSPCPSRSVGRDDRG